MDEFIDNSCEMLGLETPALMKEPPIVEQKIEVYRTMRYSFSYTIPECSVNKPHANNNRIERLKKH